MYSLKYLFIFLLVISNVFTANAADKYGFIPSINTPFNLTVQKDKREIVIAIVDDGFNTTHEAFNRFIWNNPGEIPDNEVDDDGNGFIDDINGWDISDNDNQLKPHPSRLMQFYHGTHLAGIITRILSTSLGDSAADYFKILPVKAISDNASHEYLKEGYQGIDYAINMGADIILTAWGVAAASNEELNILHKAKEKGILIIAAAGNLSAEQEQYPAAAPSVLAIGALNRHNQKLPASSFGSFVDLSAPGEDILSASAISNIDYSRRDGSSFSAAMVAAAAALVRLVKTDLSASQVKICLKGSTDPLNNIEPRYLGKLGTGKLNIVSTIKCDILYGSLGTSENITRAKGYLRAKESGYWAIDPQGRFKGLRFKLLSKQGEAKELQLSFSVPDGEELREVKSFDMSELSKGIYVPYLPVKVELKVDNSSELDYLFEYHAETIDFTREYCRDTVYLYQEGAISDGSENHDYAYHSNCKWIITAPEGKVIKFEFTELDTEAKIDKILFFDGSGAHERIMASISGPKVPPVFTSWNNQVLIWFLSDAHNQASGWKINYSFQDK